MRIGLVGGGTGGHFYPLIAIAEALRAQEAQLGSSLDIRYLGPTPYSEEALASCNITFTKIPAGKRRRYFSFLNYLDIFVTLWGVVVAFFKLLILYPDVIMSKGGYTSVPVVLAARILRIPVVIHESDTKVGAANKLASKSARYIAVAYPEAAQFFPSEKTALVGMPIRRSFFTPHNNPHHVLGIPEDKPVIFVTGGSSGAERINTLILDSLDELLPHYTIIHQVGDANLFAVRETALARKLPEDQLARYFILGHLDNKSMTAALDAAALVISRAGSTTLFEIALKGKPSIIIPIPEGISHDQKTNAYTYAKTGAATVLEESNMTDSLLVSAINSIMQNELTYQTMQTAALNFTNAHAADTLATTLLNIAQEH